jgi:hypothetical protein
MSGCLSCSFFGISKALSVTDLTLLLEKQKMLRFPWESIMLAAGQPFPPRGRLAKSLVRVVSTSVVVLTRKKWSQFIFGVLESEI